MTKNGSSRILRAGAVVAGTLALAAPSATQAATVPAELRVTAAGKNLEGGTTYLTDTTRFKTDSRPQCGGSGDVKTVPGPTALGILGSGVAVNSKLRPVGVTDKFEFALALCSAGSYIGWQDAYWLYKVNHKAPDVGADQYALEPGDSVLWYFVDPSEKSNTGSSELVVTAPARATPGEPFAVRVWAYDFKGDRIPAAGATVTADGVSTTDAQGRATVVVDEHHTVNVRAARGEDIASAPVSVCVGHGDQCPARRGSKIVGTGRGDVIRGTRGPDRIAARRGGDVVRVAGGGKDIVDCGGGRDTAHVDRRDVARANCERVVTRR
jgi:hypothetical protein